MAHALAEKHRGRGTHLNFNFNSRTARIRQRQLLRNEHLHIKGGGVATENKDAGLKPGATLCERVVIAIADGGVCESAPEKARRMVSSRGPKAEGSAFALM